MVPRVVLGQILKTTMTNEKSMASGTMLRHMEIFELADYVQKNLVE